jgi:hypothetical protein
VQGGRGRHRADVRPLGDAAAEALELDGGHAAGGRQEDARAPWRPASRRRRLLVGGHRSINCVGGEMHNGGKTDHEIENA